MSLRPTACHHGALERTFWNSFDWGEAAGAYLLVFFEIGALVGFRFG